MSEFDIFFDKYENKHNCSPEKYECFEAGQKSKQAEIDLLQKRIDEAWMWCEKGCMLKAMEILKEKKLNENLRNSFREQSTN